MINIVLYEHSKDFYQLDYSTLSTQLEIDTSNALFITPSPFHADTLRSKLATDCKLDNFDVITMSKYLKDQLVELLDEDVLKNFKGKSELMLYLSTAWKTVTNDFNIGLFRKSFNILTDLRSFSLSAQVIDTALEDYDEETQRAVSSFHHVLQLQSVIDEHLANFMLSERLRKGDLPANYSKEKLLVFWGFDFLSAVQVDLLKALAIRNEVVVPVVRRVYEKSQSSDWIQWLSEHDTNIIELASYELPLKASIKEFPSNYLSKALSQELLSMNLSMKESDITESDVYLATKNLEILQAQEANLDDHFFKVPFDLFSDNLNDFFENLRQMLEQNNDLIPTLELLEWLSDLLDRCIKEQKFRYLKVVLKFKQNLMEWFELSEQNAVFRIFDCYVFEEIMQLDMPRVSLIPHSTNQLGKIASLKELAAFDETKKNILCVTSQYGPVKSSGSQYTEKVEKYLTSIGPIRRSELEFEMLKHRLRELLQLDSSTVLIEQGLKDHDIGWNSILSEGVSEVSSADIKNIKSIQRDFVSDLKVDSSQQLKSISATRIQNYLDCPRKYFLNYISKLSPTIQVPGMLDLLKMGELEHAVIEKYVSSNSDFQEDKFAQTISETLEQLIARYDLQLSDRTKETHIVEVRSLCAPVIKNLLEINTIFGLNLSFEHGIVIERHPRVSGSIDLFANNEDTQFILDFKRSAGSIPGAAKLLEFEKVQLWFYLQRLKELDILQLDRKIVFGYVNLSRPDESLILCNNDVSAALLKGSDLQVFKKTSVLKGDLKSLLEQYEKFEQEILNKIDNDKLFLPKPITAKVCSYCAIANICTRGES